MPVGDRLFSSLEMAAVAWDFEESARRAVAAYEEADLSALNINDLVQVVIGDKVPQPLVLDITHREIDIQVVPFSGRPERMAGGLSIPDGQKVTAEALHASLYIPYSGTHQAFSFQPTSPPSSAPPVANFRGREIILSTLPSSGSASRETEAELLQMEWELQQWVAAVNADIEELRRRISALVHDLLTQRLALLQQRDSMAAGFTLPLRQVDHLRAVDIPLRASAVSLRASPVSGVGGDPEWSITDAVYEQMIKTISGFTRALERRPGSARLLVPGEETLRDWLMFMLAANYESPDGTEVFVGGETLNGNGKTDILIRYKGKNAFIGECKFWDGPSKFDKAIEQLLSYTVWRDAKAAIILFITNQSPTKTINSASARMASYPACRHAPEPAEPGGRHDYRFVSSHDDQRLISVALLPVVIPPGSSKRDWTPGRPAHHG